MGSRLRSLTISIVNVRVKQVVMRCGWPKFARIVTLIMLFRHKMVSFITTADAERRVDRRRRYEGCLVQEPWGTRFH